MTEEQIALVHASFQRASRIAPHFAATFYAELFAIDPALRALFKGDIIAQGEKLMKTLSYVIEGLREPETILPAARELAVRHVAYGVEARHYDQVGKALMRTLRHEIGQDLSPAAREAWIVAYRMLANVMCDAAYGAAPAR